MKDTATRAKLQGEWDALAQQFEAKTRAWIVSADGEKDKLGQDRADIAKELRTQYFKLQPYIRARNQFNRKDATGHSVLQDDGTAIWTYQN